MSPVATQDKKTKTPAGTPAEPRRSNLLKAAAFFAVAMLAAVAVHGVSYLQTDRAGDGALHGGASEASGLYDPDQLVQRFIIDADLVRRDAVADVDGHVGAARGAVDEAALLAEAAVLQAGDQATAAVRGAAATDGLPSVPADYLPGAPVAGAVTDAPAYAVPDFGDAGLGTLLEFEAAWQAGPSGIVPPEAVLPDELGDAQGQVHEQAGELFDDPLMGPAWVLLGIAGPEAEDTVRGAFGDDGVSEGTLDPDEDGAELARLHADALLGAGGSLLGDAEQILTLLEDQQTVLVGLVEQNAAEVRAIEAETEAELRMMLEEAVAEAVAAVPERQAQVEATAQAYVKIVDEARTDALAEVDGVVESGAAGILDAAASAEADLLAEADRLEARGAELEARVLAEAEDVLAELEALAGQGHDVDAHLRDVQVMAEQAVEDLRLQVASDVGALRSEASHLADHAQGQAGRLGSLAASAQADIEGVAHQAVALAEEARAYGKAVAEADAQATVEAHVAAAADAVGGLHAAADGQVERILATAAGLNSQGFAVVEAAQGRSDAVQKAAVLYVQEDIEYILGVAEDYAARGPADLDGRAEAWFGVHGLLSAVQDDVVLDAEAVMGEAAYIEALLAEVQAQLAALVVV